MGYGDYDPVVDLSRTKWQCQKCQTFFPEHSGQCRYCYANGTVIMVGYRPADALLPQTAGMSAADLIRQSNKHITVKACEGLVLGVCALVVVYGPPAQGKTRLMLKIADSLVPSVFVPLEQGLGANLAQYCRMLEIVSPLLRFEEVRSLEQLYHLANSGYRAMLVDSFTTSTLRPEDALRLSRANKTLVFGTCQVNKEHHCAGSYAWLHDADVVIRVENLEWVLEKSRFQECGLKGIV